MNPARPAGLVLPILLAAMVLDPAGRAAATPADTIHAAGSPRGAAAPDDSGYQKLLDDLLTVIGSGSGPIDSRFDYEKLYDLKGRYERLSRIKRGLMAVAPSSMSVAARRAWAINVYNFTVIERGTDFLLVPTRGRLRYKTLREIRFAGGLFFQVPAIEVEGRTYSLDDFEHHFLFDDFDHRAGTPLPAGLDPRIHFAIVCGAIGCPPLMPRVFRADSLDAQLEFATRNALALPRHLKLDEAHGRLLASAIFDWYMADFGGRDGAWAFILRYAPPPLRRALEEKKIPNLWGAIPWDWYLNQTVHKKEI